MSIVCLQYSRFTVRRKQMKVSYKNFVGKVSQAGSLMIEAMAMLALISLVTPTLYKKSAERTTELQDINTATNLRTVMKAVDNYVTANYQSLLEDQLQADGSTFEIDLDDSGVTGGIHDYFPYGYNFDNLKNFGTPKIVLKRQGLSITSFVQLPKKTDIGEMRAARIASMVGSNGGYVNGDKDALGVGGIWSLTQSELNNLGFDTNKGSIVVASSDAINSAATGALENEKYLQRTRVESADQLWRNTMTTDLYMGGVAGADDMYKILGVDQLIMGSTDTAANDETLVLTDNTQGGGSAWMAGTLSALSDAFTVSGDVDNPVVELTGANPILSVVNDTGNVLSADNETVRFYGNDGGTGVEILSNTKELNTDYATLIDSTLTTSGDTTLATNDGTIFQAGPAGSYINADDTSISLLDGNVTVSKGAAEGAASVTDIKTGQTNITGKTVVGTGDDGTRRVVTDPQLAVKGSAYVRDNLEVGDTLYADKFNTLELHAGGADFTDNLQKRWLHATADGVSVTNPDLATDNTILNIDRTTTYLTGPDGYNAGASPAVELGSTTAQMRGASEAEVYTTDATGKVNLQRGALVLSQTAEADTNTVDIDANVTTVKSEEFKVAGESTDADIGLRNTLYVDTRGSGEATVNAGLVQVYDETGDKNVLKIQPDGLTGSGTATVELDPETLLLSDVVNEDMSHGIVEFNLDYSVNPTMDPATTGEADQDPSGIYIRRGAITINDTSESGGGYGAGQGYGFLEASRFVSNVRLADGSIANPDEGDSTDYSNSKYYSGGSYTPYDRYMVNPAYTSVMHDIKLTTRGGARLSDILPDFINKGIYVVNNTYKDDGSVNLDDIPVSVSGNRLTISGASEVSGTLSGANMWASPFLGVVPAPQCPPGHARVITITPAGFLMAQAGQITRTAHHVQNNDGSERFVVDEYNQANNLGDVVVPQNATVTGAQYRQDSFYDAGGNEQTIYYLGYGTEPNMTYDGNTYAPQPLYFQQSTWLKSAVQAVQTEGTHNCNGVGQPSCGDSFVGWAAIMGFAYPGSLYGDIIRKVTGSTADPSSIYWNVFPVRAQTLEAYATVYCYFDRTNLYGSGNNSNYTDQYDQLNNFRKGYEKPSSGYLDRLEDPALKYNNPW